MMTRDVLRLQRVCDARATRIALLHSELQAKQAALQTANGEVSANEEELQRAQRQRALWEGEWQSWMSARGILRRGEDYNRYHVALSAWERDVREQLAETRLLQAAASREEEVVRARVVRAQLKLDTLQRHVEAQRRIAARTRQERQRRESTDNPSYANGATRDFVAWQRAGT